ncbi:hypothetical protein pb186bvf_014389 [Paramecium bursaria]
MMRQRQYFEPQKTIKEDESYEEFEQKFGSIRDDFLYFKNSDTAHKCYVSFERDRIVDYTRTDKLIQRLKSGQCSQILLITNGDPNNTKTVDKKAKSEIDKLNKEQNFRIELFHIDDLIFDITKHELVPRHIPINDEEKRALLQKYRMTESQLPRILLSDPVAKFLGLRQGNVVKIIRRSETAGEYVTYRIAV